MIMKLHYTILMPHNAKQFFLTPLAYFQIYASHYWHYTMQKLLPSNLQQHPFLYKQKNSIMKISRVTKLQN